MWCLRTRALACLALFLGLGPVRAEEQQNLSISWTPAVPVHVDGRFDHGPYSSRWSGVVQVVVTDGPGNGKQAEFRTGVGRHPGALSSHWTAPNDLEPALTDPVPLFLTAPGITGKALKRWTRLRNNANPGLLVPLSPLPDAGSFANAEAVQGQVFLLDDGGDKPVFDRYADLTIPQNGLTLSLIEQPSGPPMVELVMTGVVLDNVSADLWARVLADGNAHAPISPQAFVGTSTEFVGSHCQAPSSDQATARLALLGSLESLLDQAIQPLADLRAMVGHLDRADRNARRGRRARAVAAVIDFERMVHAASQGQGMSAGDAAHLLAQSGQLLTALAPEGWPGASPGYSVAYTPSNPEDRTRYRVAERSLCFPPLGTVVCPFQSIAGALQAAEDSGAVGVEIDVETGTYREPLTITRDTVIRKVASSVAVTISGSITNLTPALLQLEDVDLVRAELPGAIHVSNEDAVTVLDHVRIAEAMGFGVVHNGGELWYTHGSIERTRTVPSITWLGFYVGAGLILEGGAVGHIGNLRIASNESNGIVATETGTELYGADIELSGNQFNRYFFTEYAAGELIGQTGALNVRNGALVVLDEIRVNRNEFEGVLVELGGHAILTNAHVRSTIPIFVFEPLGEVWGIVGVRARTGGHLELSTFIVEDRFNGRMIGVSIGEGGGVDLYDGVVQYNAVGVAWVGDYDWHRLINRVTFLHNHVNLGRSATPIRP